MCGIAGLVCTGRPPSAGLGVAAKAMTDALVHRGPDEGGVWCDPDGRIALGTRRLAILDLSPTGHQPMTSPCGRFVLTFNGEVYNFRELREVLEERGHRFRGGSDTEVVAAACSEWGVEAALAKLNGMYGFGAWDRHRMTLTLARDRLGQKPVYLGWLEGLEGLVGFASELRAFSSLPGFRPAIEPRSVPLLLRRGCIPAPWTVFRGVWKLPQAGFVVLDVDRLRPGQDLSERFQSYWSVKEAIETGAENPFQGDQDEAVSELEALLKSAVRLCSVSDVPLGALLSGGVDSSTVLAMMAKGSGENVRSFSIGFCDRRFDEAPFASKVAAHLGTDHTELYVTEEDALRTVPRLAELNDEPFADSSQIPTLLVSSLAREHVTVALTGDGGDEVFGGYRKYAALERLLKITNLPEPFRLGLHQAIKRLPWLSAGTLSKFGSVGKWLGGLSVKENASRLAPYLSDSAHSDLVIVRLLSLWKDPESVAPGLEEPLTGLTDPSRWPRVSDPIRRAMAADMLVYLPADILTKVDRSAMAVSLETRAPLLDHRVVEFAATLDRRLLKNKAILQKVLHRHVPPRLVKRRKMGFSAPVGKWLRGNLREWAGDLVSPASLERTDIFDTDQVQAVWLSHQNSERDASAFLWPILMYQQWTMRWMNGSDSIV